MRMKRILFTLIAVITALMTMAAPSMASVPHGTLIFSDTFTGTSLNTSHWVTYVGANGIRWDDRGTLPLPYSGFNQPGATGNAIYDPAQLTVNNGLTIHAKRNTGNFSNLYGWRSGTLNTETKVSLPASGWFVQVYAKMPDMSHGMWPAFWFMPDTSTSPVPELDGFEGGFKELAGVPANRTAHYDYFSPQGQRASEQDVGFDMSAGYHYYAVKYLPGRSITWYLDGVQKFQVTSANTTIVKGTYELMVNMQVADPSTSGFHTVPTATSGDGGGYHVASVKVYNP